MPTIRVECDNCMHQHETTFWEADKVCKPCKQCENDVCEDCSDPQHPEFHRNCYEDFAADPDNEVQDE